MKEGYVIHVGHHGPADAIVGVPDRQTRRPTGDQFEVKKSVGSYLIMNRASVWGRRVLPDGKLPKNKEKQDQEDVMEVTDIRYKGDLQFLNWGDDKLGAQAIEIRLLPNSRSLDYDYQRNIQKIEVRVEQDLDQIQLTPGRNEFDYDKESLKIRYLKVHPQNRDSKSKNPDPKIKMYTYYEVTDAATDKGGIKAQEAGLVAGSFVMGYSEKPAALRNLIQLFKEYDVDFGEITPLSPPSDIYSALLKFAQTKPGDFASHVQNYKIRVQDSFEWADSHKALDLTKNGFIALVINNKPNIVWDSAEGKGKEMIEWVLENYPDEYETIKEFMALSRSLK